jgi:hypothetical protein
MRRAASGQHSLLQLLLRLLLLNARDIVAGHTCCCYGTKQMLLHNKTPLNAGGQLLLIYTDLLMQETAGLLFENVVVRKKSG